MRIGRRKGRERHARYSGPEGSTVEELAAQLAPPEESGGGNGTRQAGAIVVDTGALKMPEGFAESRRESRFEVGRVVVFVTLLMLLFTAFIAWQITLMPDDRDDPQPVRVVSPDEK
ncbi:MAG TPA: hypothetical protein VK421_11110 [Pyrinomonadaceae bacterium]|nr:hypothetical protein [Pyrinomonadaceae bacterium]